jgi:nitrite reductase/ring-hydroxylating ferredoxin subunit
LTEASVPSPDSGVVVAQKSELPPGGVKICEVDGKSIGVFNVGGAFHAILNVCPHQNAPVCLGRVTGTMLPSEPGVLVRGMEGHVLRCPWHAWEFDIVTGESLFIGEKRRLATYEVEVRNGEVVVYGRRRRNRVMARVEGPEGER